ncbi:MAG: hypothetical protein Q9160_008181 [Pyrenula sp. 1 TL-2023]
MSLQQDPSHMESKPLIKGDALFPSSVVYPDLTLAKPKAKRWDHRFSLESRSRHSSTLKGSAKANPATAINLGIGRPWPEYFPWKSATFVDVDGGCVSQSKEDKIGNFRGSTSRIVEEDAFDLTEALKYGTAAGSPQLLRFVTDHVEMVHDPPYEDWQSCLTCGATSAIDMVFRMFCERGDWLLTEEYTYPGAIEAAGSLGINVLGVGMDDEGLLPEDLDLKLRMWNCAIGPKPFLLYMIPSGQNPTGATQSLKRRLAIIEVAERHDLLIVEDDPYYLLQFQAAFMSANDEDSRTGANEYLAQLPASYLSLDRSGRVIRLDSTSKILAPGLRCGWLTSCSQLVGKYLDHTEFSTGSPSGPSQLMLYRLLVRSWGHVGLIQWLSHLSQQYCIRRNVLVKACTRHLPAEVCHWRVPEKGLFLWVRLDWQQILDIRFRSLCGAALLSPAEIEDRIDAEAKHNGVTVSKGSWFATGNKQQLIHFRLTFAAASEDYLDQGIARFAKAVCVVLGIA